MKQREISLYIHIPFCKSKCYYCDFLSAPADRATQTAYLQALLCEVRSYRHMEISQRKVGTIFIGGGTPSILETDDITAVLNEIKSAFHISQSAWQEIEITIEMNPGTVTPEKCRAYRAIGINRISIGLQSTCDQELRILGRIHDYEMFQATYQNVRDAGFDNVNIDLMSALPGQTVSSYRESLEQVVALAPEHISAYSLIIEEGTPFYERYAAHDTDYDIDHDVDALVDKDTVQSGMGPTDIATDMDTLVDKDTTHRSRSTINIATDTDTLTEEDAAQKSMSTIDIMTDIDTCVNEDAVVKSIGTNNIITDSEALPDEETEREMYIITDEILSDAGYYRYEISNYAKRGQECRHNIVYWKRGDYLGIGLGASSLIDHVRYKNNDSLEKYLSYWGQKMSANKKTDSEKTDGKRTDSETTDGKTADGETTDDKRIGTEKTVCRSICVEESNADDRYAELCRLTTKDEMEEFMFLGLRMMEGISAAEFYKCFGQDIMSVYGETIQKYVSMGMLRWTGSSSHGARLSLTQNGIDVSNVIFADFLM